SGPRWYAASGSAKNEAEEGSGDGIAHPVPQERRTDLESLPLASSHMKTDETEDGVTHRHCHGGDGGWVLGVAVGVVSVGRSTVRGDFSSFAFAFRRSRDP